MPSNVNSKSKSRLPGRLLPVMLAAILWPAVLAAQGVLGNSPTSGNAFTFDVDSFNETGAAIEFTPLQNLSLASITVWLTGYTGLDMNGVESRTLRAGIYTDDDPGGFNQPFQEIESFVTPAYNNGSLASFTFANPSLTPVLEAETPYWLFIYATATSAVPAADSYWVTGSTPAGSATYNGSESFAEGSFSPSSQTPAFTLNAVPEPGTTSLMAVSLLVAGFYAFRFRGKNAR